MYTYTYTYMHMYVYASIYIYIYLSLSLPLSIHIHTLTNSRSRFNGPGEGAEQADIQLHVRPRKGPGDVAHMGRAEIVQILGAAAERPGKTVCCSLPILSTYLYIDMYTEMGIYGYGYRYQTDIDRATGQCFFGCA